MMVATETDPDSYSGLVGILGLVFSGLYATTCLLDRIPFSSESSLISDLTIQPMYSLHSKRPGVNLQFHF